MLLIGLMLAAQTAEDPGKCSRAATPADSKWIMPGDYPAEALKRGEQGPVSYRLQVDAEGCVTACEVTESSGFSALDAVTCPLLLKRAGFEPARDANGKPVAAPYENAHWWIIQEPLPPGVTASVARGGAGSWVTNDDYPAAALRAEVSGNVGFRLEVDASGRATACTIWLSSGSDLLDKTTCSLMMRRARFTPARNAAGEAVPSGWTNGMRWRLPDQI